jgi:hypothetical protein
LRGIIGMALAIALLASFAAPALADTTTGNISGTVTANGQPVPNVAVVAVAPSGRYTAKTDAKGFYSIPGVTPDTYTITFGATGYSSATVNGVTVNPTQGTLVNQTLSGQLKTIGSTTSRATGVSAFQPQQAVDTYSVNSTQINTILGKAHATSETNLLIALPGASLDRSGYPVLRGGRENDEGFQFEGIDYTDAFTNQFVNTLALNGTQNFQLTPGAGDASIGNTGTGAINATVKRGTNPRFGSGEFDVGSPNFDRYLTGEFGFAAPNGSFSNYMSFEGEGTGRVYGRSGVDINRLSAQQAVNYQVSRDFIENAVYKFGANKAQSLQLFYQNQDYRFLYANNFGYNNFRVGDPVFFSSVTGAFGITNAELAAVTPLEYGQSYICANPGVQNSGPCNIAQPLNRPPFSDIQPNETFKLQYSNAINSSTFFTAKFYRVNAVSIFDEPYGAAAAYAFGAVGDTYSLQGGQRTGVTFDVTKQLGQKHLLGFGAKYEYLHPVDTYQSASTGLIGGALNDTALYDFLSNNPASPNYAKSCVTVLLPAFGVNPCGYLDAYFPNGAGKLPNYNQGPTTSRQDYAYYISDQFQATDKLKFNLGLRVDGSTYNYPPIGFNAYNVPGGYASGAYYPIGTDAAGNDIFQDPGQFKHPSVLQPRFALAYQFTPRDAFTFSYGRSVELPPIGFVDNKFPEAGLARFKGIPSTLPVCGPTGDRVCRDYADQLYWDYQGGLDGIPFTPVKPSTFSNFDASLQHDFGHGVALKLTPFYRRGYDVLVQTATQRIINGAPAFDSNGNPVLNPAVTSNAGINRTTGVELYLTKTAAFGLSGSFSLTYLNEFSNVIPTVANEDFFPSIPPPSLALGNLYRVGFVSPLNGTVALQYKWRNGFRLNPIIGFNNGYPYGSGLLTAIGPINGLNYNVPNTNVSIQPALGGSTAATRYVDPANPGSVFAPNVAATRGNLEGNSAGQNLTHPRVNVATVDFEYNKPGTRSTFGVLVSNIFNQIYTQPALNPRYQPVATGISGPRSGTTSGAVSFGEGLGYTNYDPSRYPNLPFLLTPSGSPTQYRFYYQLSL